MQWKVEYFSAESMSGLIDGFFKKYRFKDAKDFNVMQRRKVQFKDAKDFNVMWRRKVQFKDAKDFNVMQLRNVTVLFN